MNSIIQKELFAENIFLLTIVDSNSWIPHFENIPVKNVTLDVAFRSAKVEFIFYCDESEELSKFVFTRTRNEPLNNKICMIFNTNNNKYLVHDAVVISSSFTKDCDRCYASVEVISIEVDII